MALQWEQLSNRQKAEYGSKGAFKDAKKSTRSSGGNLSSAKAIKTVHRDPIAYPSSASTPTPSSAPGPMVDQVVSGGANKPGNPGPAPSVSNVNDFDRTAGGAGSNRGNDRLSSADLKNLRGQGHSLEDIVSYAEKSYEEGSKGGGANSKAGRLLAQYKEELRGQTQSTDTTTTVNPPTQGNTQVSGPNPNAYQSNYDPDKFFNRGNNQTNESINSSSNTSGSGVSINQSNSQNTQIYQDNDLINTINGNNNTVDNNVDNSVKVQNGNQSNASSSNGRFAGDALADAMKDGSILPVTSSTSKEYSTDVNDNKYAKTINSEQGNSQNTDVYQDNDIINTVTGDNNRIENNVDNSIRNYGGNQKNFTYVGGENPLLDTPVSAGTMAGYFHDDDSPAKSAAFVDRHVTMNRDNAKRRKMFGTSADDFIYKAQNLPGFSPKELDKVNRRGPQLARDRAAGIALNLFGDRYASSVKGWESPERQSGVEQPDYDELYDKYTDF